MAFLFSLISLSLNFQLLTSYILGQTTTWSLVGSPEYIWTIIHILHVFCEIIAGFVLAVASEVVYEADLLATTIGHYAQE